ncbi:hypothetical protein F2P56_026447 [Juglans regia]|uniref:Cyclin-dependent kinase inhibitor n=2 Tax=Juglans regia TaxID=51240 RepID=A0A2I4H9R1_JUGRE|nr:cyclin-dependent kinase inhibitor 7-like [Juglans regia]KAF5451331.1 hypothetical protein F2P56_026447 [Juglans regia]
MRKCRPGIADIAVMVVAQVGVRARARAAPASSATTTTKRRKLDAQELKFSQSSSSSFVQLRNRRSPVISPESTEEGRCSSPSSDHHVATSCCSSNGSSSLLPEEERIEFVDLQDGSSEVETSTYNFCRERRETTPSSEPRAESANLESTARPTEANSRPRSRVEKRKMPTESEIEEFFADAEKDLQKRFVEKYNYDVFNDVPLEGRYEWVRLKP